MYPVYDEKLNPYFIQLKSVHNHYRVDKTRFVTVFFLSFNLINIVWNYRYILILVVYLNFALFPGSEATDIFKITVFISTKRQTPSIVT